MKGLKISELINELNTMLEEQGDMPVMVGIKDHEKKEVVIDIARNVSMENYNNVYYCEIS